MGFFSAIKDPFMPRPAPNPETPLRVLVIEDDLLFQEIISKFLNQSSGGRITVIPAGDLNQGLERLAAQPFDAVLLDLTLPDSEGLETLLTLQEHGDGVPIIVLTGLDDEQIAADAVRHGAQDFLVKSDLSASVLTRSIRYAIERTRSETALRASESRFRAVVEDQTELVCRFQSEGGLTFVNPTFGRYFDLPDLPPEELPERNFFDLTGIDQAEFSTFDFADEPTRSREQELVVDSSSSVWIQWTDRALFNAQGRLAEFQSVGRDTTEQKQLERQLYQSQKMETLGRLAGGVAHDFNNLLTVIIGCCEMLTTERRRTHLPPHPQVEEINKAADRATALTRQLLAVSRRHVAQPTVLDLNQVVRQTQEMLVRLISEQVELRVELEDDLALIKADRAQIEQILVNLVVNARDAMPGGGKLMVTTASDEAGASLGGQRYAELVVSDTGTGMDPSIRDKIFDPFFTTKEAGQGTGLGLSIVDSLVKQSRGSIELDTELGRGTRFRIRLPVTEETLQAEEPEPLGDTPDETTRRMGRILLVEDEILVRDVVTALLQPQGFEVHGAASAEEALSQLEDKPNQSFDVLLTDVVLPGQNGFQLADEVKSRFPEMRILFMSGYTDAARGNEEWLDDGAHFLQKPFAAGELLSKLDEVLRH